MLRRLIIAIAAGLVAAVVALPAQAGGGGHCPNPTADRRGTEVVMSRNCFVPGILRAPSGAEVTFTNDDAAPHTVTGLGYAWGNDRDLSRDESVTMRFTKDGIYPYACLLHPGMIGVVVVGDANSSGLSSDSPVELEDADADSQEAVPAAASGGNGGGPGLALLAGGVLIGAGATGTLLLRRRAVARSSTSPSTSP